MSSLLLRVGPRMQEAVDRLADEIGDRPVLLAGEPFELLALVALDLSRDDDLGLVHGEHEETLYAVDDA